MGNRVRQAVVVVHGIGEQRPLATLRSYVDAITGRHDLKFGAPDQVSGFSDLKRMKVTWLPEIEPPPSASESRSSASTAAQPPISTDFYELYWAHLVQGTELRHVLGWLLGMVPRWPALADRFKRFLRFHTFLALVVLVVALAVFGFGWAISIRHPDLGAALRWLAGIAGAAALSWVVLHLGDVPRYLHNVASNVSIQRAVRRQGVELLHQLHAHTYTGSTLPMYERVIVVGHSLGSVVAYDIVRDAWSEVYRHYAIDPTQPNQPATKAADNLDADGEDLWRRGCGDPVSVDCGFTSFQDRQRALLAAINEHGRSRPPGEPELRRWMVTDLVTLACPLTHADFLLAASHQDLVEAQWRRQLASCPPRRQMAKPSYRFNYIHGPRKGRESWHQAAPFATTRWTNVYFASDVVGGPLQPLFGPGIVDIQLENPSGLRGRMPRVHSQYSTEPACLEILRRVIWDGCRRSPTATLDPLLKQSLLMALRELTDSLTRGLPAAEALAGIRLLGGLTSEQRTRVLAAIEGVDRPQDVDLGTVVESLAEDRELLRNLLILDTLIPSSLEDHSEVEEEQAEEEEPEEEEE